MPRKKRSPSPFELYDDEFDEDASSQNSINGQPPVQRNAANARERMRMRVLSSAYGRLKTKLPNIPPDTKLSKLDTLRLATLYIKQLITAVENGSTVNGGSVDNDTNQMAESVVGGAFNFHNGGHGMSWPFEFHHMASQQPQHSSNANRQLSNYQQQNRMDWSHTSATELTYASKTERQEHQQHQQNCVNYDHSSSDAPAAQHLWYHSQGITAQNLENVNTGGCVFETLHGAHNNGFNNQRMQHHLYHQPSL